MGNTCCGGKGSTACLCSGCGCNFSRQFCVLAWKNATLKVRHWLVLLTELAIPVIIIALIGVLRNAINPTIEPVNIPDSVTYPIPNLNYLYANGPNCAGESLLWRCAQDTTCETFPSGCQLKKIGVAPSDAATSAAVTAAANFVATENAQSSYSNDTFVYFDSESSFLSYIGQDDYSLDPSIPIYSALVVFSDGYPSWDYTLRFNDTYYDFFGGGERSSPSTNDPIIDISLKYGQQWPQDGQPYAQAYDNLGVTTLNNEIASFIATQSCISSGNCASGVVVGVNADGIVDFPNKEAKINGFWGAIGFIFALLMIMTLLYPIANVIRALVQEKESKIREGMAMMSMRYDALWLSWLFHFLCLFLPLSIILTIVSQQLFVYSDPVFIFFYFFLFFISAISYAILVSILFNRTLTATIVGCLVFFMGFFIYVGLSASGSMRRGQIMAASLHPAAAFTFGTLSFIEYEDGQIGITAQTWNASNEYSVTFQDMLNMMFIDAIWMGVVSWYLSKVWPSEYGTHEPWYFIFLPRFWLSSLASVLCCKFAGSNVGIVNYNQIRGDFETGPSSVPVEDVPDALKAQFTNKTCIDVIHISKTFETATGVKTAVDNLSLTFFSGQITALLGHNGAGKTTLIGMLTGLMPPTAGTAVFEGLDLRTDMQEIRRNLGVCPQHDILFPDLTVEEHLSLFASFKGVSGAELTAEVTKMIESVGLVEKRKVYARQLSGGQKRKLSVGIAFIGGSRVVILDEPTSGMDPYSRRFTWNVIRQYKENRVIVLTTHFMDEADLLGDRIAIMGDGKLCCCGSSLFLKKNFGVGYNLVVEKLSAMGSKSEPVKELIEGYIPDSNMLTDVGTEITFQLPLAAASVFPKMFADLDNHLEQLGVRSYGMSVTTLEEVFIKIAHGTSTNAAAAAGLKLLTEEKRKKSLSSCSNDVVGLEMMSPVTGHGGRENVKSIADIELGVASRSMGVGRDLSDKGEGSGKELIVNGTANGNGNGDRMRNHLIADDREFNMVSPEDTWVMFWKHVHACMFKRFLYFKRDIKSFIFLYMIPVVFVLIGALVVSLVPFSTKYKNLTISGHFYNPSISTDYLPTAYSNASAFCTNTDYGNNNQNVDCIDVGDTQSLFMQSLAVGDQLPVTAVDVRWIYNMSQYLYTTMDSHKSSTIGAISYQNLTSSNTGSFFMTYLIHANFTALHAVPVYQNWVLNGLVASYDPSITVATSIHPLPQTAVQKSIDAGRDVDLIASFILLSIPFVAASFATFVVREREVKAKHQQLVSGVSIVAFWLSCWIWDFISYQPTLWSYVIIICACPGTSLLSGISSGALGCLIGLLILFGSSISSFSYLISMLFATPGMTQIVVIFTMFILGLILGIVGVVLRILPVSHSVFLHVVRYVLALIPPFALADGLHNLSMINIWSVIELGGGDSYKPTDWRITGLPLAFLGAETVFYLLLVMAIEYVRLIPSVSNYFTPQVALPPNSTPMDEDVIAEETAIAQVDPSTTQLRVVVKDAKKMYPGGKYAVRGVSLGIPNGQCFGLLGINGAGKTTLLSMLSGEVVPTHGSMYLDRRNIATDVHNCRRLIGYCPQFDALFELLTGREHLQLYARIKGIVESEVDAAVSAKIAEMGLTEYADRAAGTYSGGNKRKLSVAIAMIGDPSIVFLDEPSTGMDPVARRFMWEVISDVVCRREKCSVILTTHSMEECEALCTRIGIMVGGLLRCLGSSQHLRNRFGHGIQIEMGMILPTNEQIEAKCQDLLASVNPPPTEVAVLGMEVGNVGLSQQQLFALFAAKGMEAWASRIHISRSGTDIATALESTGTVQLKQVANWWILESGFDAIAKCLVDNFGSFVLRERQNHKIRVEITSYVNQIASADFGSNAASSMSASDNAQLGPKRRLCDIFAVIESNKNGLGIQEYSVAQTSLEQIFNQFAAKQEEETGAAAGIL